MPLLRTLIKGLSSQPGYTLMRGVARFATARNMAYGIRRSVLRGSTENYLRNCEAALETSLFADLDRTRFVHDLEEYGLAMGLQLPAKTVREIIDFAQHSPCYADRQPNQGFLPADHNRAEAALGKPILLAQYFNAESQCNAIKTLSEDPMLRWIAARYLGSLPTLVGTNMWWTFPVQASQADRDLHAHLFHRDVDDFRFFKFFFYLTDVTPGEGAHVCVVASHKQPPILRSGDQWNIRRYADSEINSSYPTERIFEICGDAGTGFAENTLCVHKGLTPRSRTRLLLQIQFALFDYGIMHDRIAPGKLQQIC